MKIGLLSIAGIVLSLPLAAQNVRETTQISCTTTAAAFDPAVAAEDNKKAILYNDSEAGGMFVRVSTDGKTWGAKVRVDDDPTGARKDTVPSGIAIVKNRIYVLWEDQRGANEELYFNYSYDCGATWLGEEKIDTADAAQLRDWQMTVRAGSLPNEEDDIHIIFTADSTGSTDETLYLNSSSDGGLSFFNTAIKIVDRPSGIDIDGITMGVDDSNQDGLTSTIHVAWTDNFNGQDDGWYSQSVDGGLTWSNPVQFDSSGPSAGDLESTMGMGVDGDTIAIAYHEENSSATNEEIRVAVSTDGGVTWPIDQMVGGYDTATDDADNLWFAMNGSVMAVAYEDNRTGTDEIYCSTSLDGGTTWSESLALSTTGGGFPRVAVNNTFIVAVCWAGGGFPEGAYSAFSWDAGNSWDVENLISSNTGDVDFVEIAVDDDYNDITLAWLSDDNSINNVYTAGYRTATLTVGGPITAAASVDFNYDFVSFDSGAFMATLISDGTGSFLLPFGDNRNVGLLQDAILQPIHCQ